MDTLSGLKLRTAILHDGNGQEIKTVKIFPCKVMPEIIQCGFEVFKFDGSDLELKNSIDQDSSYSYKVVSGIAFAVEG